MSHDRQIQAVTVTLNPAIDQTLRINNFTAGHVNRVEQTYSHPGGKGVNVAAALADYGHPVAATGFLGRDNCELFETMFAGRGIEDRFIRIPGLTRTGLKITDPVSQQTTDINFPGLCPEATQLDALVQTLEHLAQQGRWFVLSGSVPTGSKTSVYAEMIKLLKQQGAKVCLDTSGEALRIGAEALPDILKPNIHELQELTGFGLAGRAEVLEAARTLIQSGVELVAVSMGEQGALFVNATRCCLARPPQIDVKSTVGAGDAMVAGIIAAQLRGDSLENCARRATAFSLEVLTRGEPGLSSSAAVERWMTQVVVEE